MSRYAGYIRALATGYGLLAVNIAYSLAMVPLALAHLGKETFGLWALTLQIGVITQVAENGMTAAFSRILIDHKDDQISNKYRQVFFTMWLFFILLGATIAALITLFSTWIMQWLNIPEELQTGYSYILVSYAFFIGISMAFRPLGLLLFIHQRSDVLNITSILGQILGFGLIWHLLGRDWGLWSLLAGLIFNFVLTTPIIAWQVVSRNYIPRWRQGVTLSWPAFLEVFAYGKDRLSISSGLTLLQVVPTILISRTLGLEANAVWTVATRLNLLCLQLITRLSDFSFPALAEMHVRGEQKNMRRRYSNLLTVGLGASIVCSAAIASCNSQMVHLWTSGRIHSSPLLDSMLALWLITQTLQRYTFIPAGISKNMKGIRTSYLKECCFVAVLGWFLLPISGSIWPLALIHVAASLLLTIPRFLKKASSVLQSGVFEILRPLGLLGCRVAIPAAVLILVMSFMRLPTSWGWLLLQASLIGGLLTLLLSSIPDLRNILAEMIHRFALKRARST